MPLNESACVALRVPESDADCVVLAVSLWLGEAVGERVPLPVSLVLCVCEGESDALGVSVALGVRVPVALGVGVGDGDCVCDSVTAELAVADPVPETDWDCEGD